MKLSELIKKPVSLIIENNIVNDIVYAHDTVQKIVDKVLKSKSPENFLVVCLNSDGKAEAAITYRNFSKVLEHIIKLHKQGKDFNNVQVSELNLKEIAPLEFYVSSNSSISKVIPMLTEQKTDIIIVLDKDEGYLGKITRAGFIKNLDMLTN